jgi:hypothetical protein
MPPSPTAVLIIVILNGRQAKEILNVVACCKLEDFSLRSK